MQPGKSPLRKEPTIKRLLRRAVLAGACGLAAPGASAQDVSAAEKLLFQTNHMQGMRGPAVLTYIYRREGSAADFDDEVRLDVSRINPDHSAAVSVRFLSGDRSIQLPDLENARGNPALLGFLERDITEMKRATGGSRDYFRKRIRLALAEARELHPVRFRYAGKERAGQEVRIQPYRGDRMRERFPAYENKSYAFVVSQEVPGGLYRIRTASEAPTAIGGVPGTARIVETLTLSDKRLPGKPPAR
jgi:hypothetical protein